MSRKKKNEDTEVIWVFIGTGILSYILTKDIIISIIVFIISSAIYFTYIAIKADNKRKKYLQSGINIVDRMDGEVFEEFLLAHFQNLGYRGKLTPKTNDYGADLVLHKDGQTIVVQAKRYTNKVGIAAIQEIIGAKDYYKANKCLVITNNYFTSNAIKLANSGNVELWDRKRLIEVMTRENGKENIEKFNKEPQNRVCKVCGANMILRRGKYGSFYGCNNYPQCKHIEKY